MATKGQRSFRSQQTITICKKMVCVISAGPMKISGVWTHQTPLSATVTCTVVPVGRGKAANKAELGTEDKLCNHSAYEN